MTMMVEMLMKIIMTTKTMMMLIVIIAMTQVNLTVMKTINLLMMRLFQQ